MSGTLESTGSIFYSLPLRIETKIPFNNKLTNFDSSNGSKYTEQRRATSQRDSKEKRRDAKRIRPAAIFTRVSLSTSCRHRHVRRSRQAAAGESQQLQVRSVQLRSTGVRGPGRERSCAVHHTG